MESKYRDIAVLLKINEKDLERESLKLFLEEKLKKLEIERFAITKKYGVSSIDEMEKFYREKKISEKDSWEDFFRLDHIETEIETTKKAIYSI